MDATFGVQPTCGEIENIAWHLGDREMNDGKAEVVYAEEPELSADEFMRLAQQVWPRDYSLRGMKMALKATVNLTARVRGQLVGSVRILTDGYLFGTIPEILVHPAFQGRGIGRALMERAWDRSPTGLFFGAQEGNEGFFEKLGYERSMASFARQKPRPTGDGGQPRWDDQLPPLLEAG